MEAGFRAAWVIPLSDIAVDGVFAPPLSAVCVGATWTCRGPAQALINPGAPLRLTRPVAPEDEGRLARRLLRPPAPHCHRVAGLSVDPAESHHIALTDGLTAQVARVVADARGTGWLFVFDAPPPAPDRMFWIIAAHLPHVGSVPCDGPAGLLPGTEVLTPRGLRRIETLGPGDVLVTRDRGPLPVLQVTAMRIGGGRLFAQPGFRPVCLDDLRVGPGQVVLHESSAAEDLFRTPEVLIRAGEMTDDRDLKSREIIYLTPCLPVPALILAAGRWVAADLPPLRVLTRAEAAILRHGTG